MKNKIFKITLFLFILSLFFPIRHVFLTKEAYLTGQYSDFTSFSLYLSDILLFTTCFLLILPPRTKSLISLINKTNNEVITLPNTAVVDKEPALVLDRRGREIWAKIKGFSKFWLLPIYYFLPTTLLLFWLILGLILHFSTSTIFWTLKWLELIVAYETAAALAASYKLQVTSYKWRIAKVFVGFSVIQSIIALLQFYKQTSLGLYRLGESHLSANTYNVAKLVVDGHTYIRAYGTFPHPNLLAAFLVTGIMLSIYLFISTNKKWQILWGISIFLNILGLTITFSRGAYLALVIGLLIYLVTLSKILFFDFMEKLKFSNYVQILFSTRSNNMQKTNEHKKPLLKVFVIVIISSAFSFLLFRSFLLTRVTISDNAVVERIEYNKIGLNMIQANPIFGVGAGESVLHMQQYLPHTNFNNDKNQNYQKLNQQSMPIDSFSSKKLEEGETKLLKPWQKQPIHNYFLLSAAELGIPGALILIWFFLYHLKVLISKLKASQDFQSTAYYLLLATILCSFLILMLFDHYFYTLQQTQLLLWIILGIIASIKKETRVP